jgi:hypothetical protein
MLQLNSKFWFRERRKLVKISLQEKYREDGNENGYLTALRKKHRIKKFRREFLRQNRRSFNNDERAKDGYITTS